MRLMEEILHQLINITLCTVFYTCQVVQDFFHQQYEIYALNQEISNFYEHRPSKMKPFLPMLDILPWGSHILRPCAGGSSLFRWIEGGSNGNTCILSHSAKYEHTYIYIHINIEYIHVYISYFLPGHPEGLPTMRRSGREGPYNIGHLGVQ